MLPSEILRTAVTTGSAAPASGSVLLDPVGRLTGRYSRALGISGRNTATTLGELAEACFRERAKGVQNLAMKPKRDNPATAQEELEELPSSHWAARLLKRPNWYTDRRTFFGLATQQLDKAGMCFIWTPAQGQPVPSQMYLIPPTSIMIVPGNNPSEPIIKNYRVWGGSGGGAIDIPEREMCVIRHPWPWPDAFRMMFVGRSMVDTVHDAIEVDREAMQFLRSFFENDTMGAFGISIKESLSAEQYNDVVNRIQEAYGGSRNAGKMILLEAGAVPVSFSPSGQRQEVSILEQQNRTRICMALGTPESILSAKHENRASAESVEASFFRRTISDLGTMFTSALSSHFSRFEYGIEIVIDDYVSNDPDDRRADEQHLFSLGVPPNQLLKKRGVEGIGPAGDLSYFSTAVAPQPAATATAATPTSAPAATPTPVSPAQAPANPAPAAQSMAGHAYHSDASDAAHMLAVYWKRADTQAITNAAIIARGLRKVISWAESVVVGDAVTASHTATSGPRYNRATFDLQTAQEKTIAEVGPTIGATVDQQLRQAVEDAGMTWEEAAPMLASATSDTYAEIMENVSASIAKIHDEIGDLGLAMTGKPAEDVRLAMTSRFAVFAGPRAETIAEAAAKLSETRAKRAVWSAISPRADGKVMVGRWVIADPMTARDTHYAANGQLADRETKLFTVGGIPMYGPGDPAPGASAKEVFRCRCTMIGEWV